MPWFSGIRRRGSSNSSEESPSRLSIIQVRAGKADHENDSHLTPDGEAQVRSCARSIGARLAGRSAVMLMPLGEARVLGQEEPRRLPYFAESTQIIASVLGLQIGPFSLRKKISALLSPDTKTVDFRQLRAVQRLAGLPRRSQEVPVMIMVVGAAAPFQGFGFPGPVRYGPENPSTTDRELICELAVDYRSGGTIHYRTFV